jgi:hypothetical protein
MPLLSCDPCNCLERLRKIMNIFSQDSLISGRESNPIILEKEAGVLNTYRDVKFQLEVIQYVVKEHCIY